MKSSIRFVHHLIASSNHPDYFTSLALFNELFSHTRYLITLRSGGVYHSLLLFRLSKDAQDQDSEVQDEISERSQAQVYVMESSCPHLGADLSHAEIEECGVEAVAVCPWHR